MPIELIETLHLGAACALALSAAAFLWHRFGGALRVRLVHLRRRLLRRR